MTKDHGSQDAEVFDMVVKQRIQIHDYEIRLSYPNLYEYFNMGNPCYSRLTAFLATSSNKSSVVNPHSKLAALLRQHLSSDGPSLPHGPLRILDIAAGKGRLGIETCSQLGQQPGISCLVGTDLMESAKLATISDQKPSPYDEYVVADLTDSSQPDIHRWKKIGFDVVTICAALGPGDGDLPLEVVDAAIEFLRKDGLLVFHVNAGLKDTKNRRDEIFLSGLGHDGETTHWKDMRKVDRKVYTHRLSVKGKPIEYTALIYQKMEQESVRNGVKQS